MWPENKNNGVLKYKVQRINGKKKKEKKRKPTEKY